jgi:hypothetical protein
VGGVTGAVGFGQIGLLFSLPFAALLLVLAGPPLVEDVFAHAGQARRN